MPAPQSLIRYIREASRLRHAIKLSEIDEAFATAGGHVHYILDTNVVGMFMGPVHHIDQLGMFSSWLDLETLTATATLTSEFLLSKNLPGQRGESATLSPDHYEEVIGLADRAKAALAALPAEEFDHAVMAMERSREQLTLLADKIRNPRVATEDKFNALTAILPKEVASLVQGPIAELLQLKRAFEGDCIYRVDGMPWFHASALKANSKQELDWYRRIRNARHEIARTQDPHGRDPKTLHDKTINEMRDARTMSLITQLTEEFADPEEQRRFLFVTADGAIRRAVESYVSDESNHGGAGKLDVFIRHPREFVPLLNLGTISGDDELRSVFGNLKATLDELLTGVAASAQVGTVYIEPTDEEIEGSLALGGGTGSRSTAAASADAKAKLNELRDLWGLACRSALSLGLSLLKTRDEVLFGGIAQVITAPDLKSHIQENIVGVLDDLLRDHAGLNVRGAFSAVRRLDSRRRQGGISAESRVLRVPLHLVKPGVFSEFIGSSPSLNEYLLHIAKGGELDELADYLAGKGRDPVAYLFMACICLAVGLWDAAKDFAKRSFSMPGRKFASRDGLATARYVFAVAHRMSLSTRAEVKTAEAMLEVAIKDHDSRSDERTLSLRSMSELAAVKLAAVEQTLYSLGSPDRDQQATLVKAEDISRYLQSAGSSLSTVIHSAENNFPSQLNELSGLLLQAYANAAAFSIITTLVPQYHKLRNALELSNEDLVAGFDRSMQKVQTYSPIIKVYLQVLRATSASRQSDIDSLRQSALQELANVRLMSLVLPRMDIEVAEFLTDKLRPRPAAE
jgi:hypothetical protein